MPMPERLWRLLEVEKSRVLDLCACALMLMADGN